MGTRIFVEDFYGFHQRNERYNNIMSSIIDDILQTESVGKEGYQKVGKYDKDELIFSSNDDSITYSIPNLEDMDFKEFSEYENMLASNILWGEFTTYVIAGGMGTGKTSSMNYIFQKIVSQRECPNCIYSYVNFNEGFNSDSPKETLEIFRIKLFNKLKQQIADFLEENDRVDTFVSFLSSDRNKSKFSDFYDFRRAVENGNGDWKARTVKGKIDFLFDYIGDSYPQKQLQLEMLMLLLNYLRSSPICSNSCFILVYDNLDRLPPEAQLGILHEILSLNEISKVRCVVPLRRSPFKRFNNRYRAAFSYGYIHHYGPSPENVLLSRLC